MSASDKQKEYAKKHQSLKLDEIKLRPPKGTKDRWSAHAARRGKSLTRFVIDAVEREIKSPSFSGPEDFKAWYTATNGEE